MTKNTKRKVLAALGAIGILASLTSAPVAGVVLVITKSMEQVVSTLPVNGAEEGEHEHIQLDR